MYRRQFHHLQIGGKNFKIRRVVLEIMGFEEDPARNDIKRILVQNRLEKFSNVPYLYDLLG